MLQLPVLPASQGATTLSGASSGKGGNQPAVSPDSAPENPFDQQMQEMIDDLEEGVVIALPLMPGVEGSDKLTPFIVTGGNLLPFNPAANGKTMPQTAIQLTDSSGLQTASPPIGTNAQADMKTALLLGQLIQGGAKGELAGLTVVAEGVALEGRTTGEIAGGFNLAGFQAVGGGTAARPGMEMLRVDVPVSQPGWDQAVGERIQWMLGRNIQSAEIKLTPPHMGPMEIRISVQNDQASVSFIAQQPLTREALEAAIPRLRDMLGEANLNLANVDVGQHESREASADANGDGGRGGRGSMTGSTDLPEPGSSDVTRRMSDGLVDDYA
ncbi:flagellar hook-length control protein FliK [endosymbiont of Lamellibrachia barhami]|uniref:flagellar hook-length control protein FliK n=1 Tax=endosymbiont of Lamellibrachia barhami TaxID=205975 RepID=UPI001FE32A0E|nr:flagellar hook-length control protein FliK [endosymbiont of Lamellibrachia barhami]